MSDCRNGKKRKSCAELEFEDPVAEEITPRVASVDTLNVLQRCGIEHKLKSYSMFPTFIQQSASASVTIRHNHNFTEGSAFVPTTSNDVSPSKLLQRSIMDKATRDPDTFSGFLQKQEGCFDWEQPMRTRKKSTSNKETPGARLLVDYKQRLLANLGRKDFSSSQRFPKKQSRNREIQVMKRQIKVEATSTPVLKKFNSCRKFSIRHCDTETFSESSDHYCKYLLEPPIEGTLIIDIVDNGCGMTEEESKKLFKPFSQANKETYSKYGGTGLGMWISHKLVTAMGGTINCRSIKSEGTTFTISLPARWKKRNLYLEVILLIMILYRKVRSWFYGNFLFCAC